MFKGGHVNTIGGGGMNCGSDKEILPHIAPPCARYSEIAPSTACVTVSRSSRLLLVVFLRTRVTALGGWTLACVMASQSPSSGVGRHSGASGAPVVVVVKRGRCQRASGVGSSKRYMSSSRLVCQKRGRTIRQCKMARLAPFVGYSMRGIR